MIEKDNFILNAYIDGTLPQESQEEFDSLVRSQPQLFAEVEAKRSQVNQVRTLIPKSGLTKDVRENLEREIKNTLDQFVIEPKMSLWERVVDKFNR